MKKDKMTNLQALQIYMKHKRLALMLFLIPLATLITSAILVLTNIPSENINNFNELPKPLLIGAILWPITIILLIITIVIYTSIVKPYKQLYKQTLLDNSKESQNSTKQ